MRAWTRAPPSSWIAPQARQAGGDLKNFERGLLVPDIKINTSPTDYFPIGEMQMSHFNGKHDGLFGAPISGEIGTQWAPARRGGGLSPRW